MEKVFVFGIDGAFPEYIFEEWLDELPNIKRLMDEGSYARLNSTIPPLSATAWSSIFTGKSPADTGIFEYIYRKNHSYEDIHVITSKNIKEKSVWEIASDYGKKSIVCYPILSWPIKPINGILISGALTPIGPEIENVYPSELREEIKNILREIPPPNFSEFTDASKRSNFRTLSKEEIIKGVYDLTEKHIKLMKYLLKNKEWDFFFGLIGLSDRMNHSFFRYMDKGHRKYDPCSEFKDTLKEYYKFVDKKLGELLLEIDKDAKIIILSDHGIKRMHNRINLTDWLIKEEYLVLKEPIREKCKFDFSMVNWEKTKVFAIGAYEGQIFINLKGREPKGIIEEYEYPKLIEELKEKIEKIPGDDGKELDTKIFIKKKDYDGKLIEDAPDMIIYFDNLQYGSNNSLIGNETLWSPSTARGTDDATHSQQGIFIMKNNKSQKGNIGEISYLDVAPIILNELDIKMPEDMKGKIIK